MDREKIILAQNIRSLENKHEEMSRQIESLVIVLNELVIRLRSGADSIETAEAIESLLYSNELL